MFIFLTDLGARVEARIIAMINKIVAKMIGIKNLF